MSQLVRAMVAHVGTQAAAPELYGIHRLVLDVAERRDLPREKAAALLNLADLDAQTGRTTEALAPTGPRWTPDAKQMTRMRPAARWNP